MWLIEIIKIITLMVILVITLVVWPLLLIPFLILLRTIVVDEVHILLGFRTVVPCMPNVSTLFTRHAGIMNVHDFLLLIGSFFEPLHQ
jgi:hypothetical protein